MKNHIAEDLPARKHPAAAAEQGKKDGHKEKGGKSPEERVRQAVYDIRYRARREELSPQQAYSQYMQNSNMSQQEKTLVKGKLFGKGPMKEDFHIEDFASTSVANALYKVFAEGAKTEEPIRLTYMEKMETAEDRKYKVKVTGKDGRSYVRYATREKINSLRANPNIQSVEMSEYGDPYEGEAKKGEQTAAVKSGKDYDGDGKVESGAKEYRGSVHNAIQRKKGGVPDGKDTSSVKEAFIGEVKVDKTTGEKIDKPIDVMKGSNKVVISPDIPGTGANQNQSLQMAHYDMEGPFITEKAVSKAQQKFMGMVYARKKGKKAASPEVAKAAAGMSKEEAKKFAQTKHKGLPVHKEETECEKEGDKKEVDPRQLKTMKDKTRTALGLMGLKMSYEPDGELVDEALRSREERMARTITPAQRKKQEDDRKKKQEIEHRANLALAGMKKTAKPGAATKTTSKSSAPESNRKLPKGKKVDTLAVKASKVISADYQPEGKLVDEGTEEAQERRFKTKGHRSEGETMTAAIRTAATAKDTLEARRKKFKSGSPKGEELGRRSERMDQRIGALAKARRRDKSEFRQGRVGSPKPENS